MNVVFRDKLSQQAWHQTRRFNPEYTEALDNWITGMFLGGGWCDQTLPPLNEKLNRPDWQQQTGDLKEVRIHADWNSMEVVNGQLVCGEFDWAIVSYKVDRYGMKDGDPRTVINGGFINHSRDINHPDWSSHT